MGSSEFLGMALFKPSRGIDVALLSTEEMLTENIINVVGLIQVSLLTSSVT